MVITEFESFRNSDRAVSDMFSPPGAAVAPTPSLLSWDWVGRMFSPVQVFTPIWKFAWSRQDELQCCQRTQAVLDSHRRGLLFKGGTTVVADAARIEGAFPTGPYNRVRFILSPMILSSCSKSLQGAWLARTTVEIARTAIALKRYELRHGKLPYSLDALVPEFLPEHPVDYMDGKPLRYCLESESTFVLYSVGADGRDDGGDGNTVSSGSYLHYRNSHDVVWPQPAGDAEVAVWRVGRP